MIQSANKNMGTVSHSVELANIQSVGGTYDAN